MEDRVIIQLDLKEKLHRDNPMIKFLMHVLRTPNYSLKTIMGKQKPNECNVFSYPCDVVVDEKRSLLFVSDCGELNIQVFNLFTMELLYNIKTSDRPRFMAIYYNSLIFTSEDGLVYRYDLETRKEIWKSAGADQYSPKMKNPCGVLVDEMRQSIYVCECDGDRIHIINGENGKGRSMIDFSVPKSMFSLLRKNSQEYTPRVTRPYGIAFSMDNNHLVVSSVVDATIHLINKKGQIVLSFGQPGSRLAEFNFPSSLIVDRNNGNILVCDRNNSRIQVFSGRGSFLKTFGNQTRAHTIESLYQPRGLCIDHATGDLFVTDYGNDRVCVYSQFN